MGRPWLATAIATAGLCCPVACARHPGEPPTSPDASAGAPSGKSARGPQTTEKTGAHPQAEKPGETISWLTAIRGERWNEAALAIDRLDKATQDLAWVRLARARAALGERTAGDSPGTTENGNRALLALEGLEIQRPELEGTVLRLRAEAQWAAGQYVEAARYFAKSPQATDRIRAARSWEKAGALAEAQTALDQVLLALHGKSGDVEAEARHLRAKIAERQGRKDLAIGDYRWIATEAPLSPQAADAERQLTRLVAGAPLAPEQRLARVQAFSQKGRVAETEAELAQLQACSPMHPDELMIARARGYARLNARTDLVQAAELLERAAALGKDPKDTYYSARARTRAGQEPAALGLLDQVARGPRASEWAERARYEAARLELVQGHWATAERRYSEYLKQYPKGPHRAAAEYDRAIALLSEGNFNRAAIELSRLMDRAESAPEKARLQELRGVAWWSKGAKAEALTEWRQVVADYPLSLAAALAGERLALAGEPRPNIPQKNFSPSVDLPLRLPAQVTLLTDAGLDREAEQALFRQEKAFKELYQSRATEAQCRAYGTMNVAERQFAVGRHLAARLSAPPGSSPEWAWNCSFPRPHQETVTSLERELTIPQGFTYAVMRQESAFRPEVRSPVDARGLMQLMPATAERVAAELQIEWNIERLSSSIYNLNLGSHYLAKLLRRFGEHPVLAAAAYNAGPEAVSRWLAGGESLYLDLFIARIPFPETRNYVHQVLSNWTTYQYLSEGPQGVSRVSLKLPLGLRSLPGDY